jgi:hypothetical protein
VWCLIFGVVPPEYTSPIVEETDAVRRVFPRDYPASGYYPSIGVGVQA